MTVSQSSSVTSNAGLRRRIPALFTSTSSPAKVLYDLVKGSSNVAQVKHVQGISAASTAQCLDARLYCLGIGQPLRYIGDGNRRPGLGQSDGQRGADSACGAGDQSNLPLKTESGVGPRFGHRNEPPFALLSAA